ncbi:MAG: Holliday junction resolvase RuvX [Vicinamibacterales bacterium]
MVGLDVGERRIGMAVSDPTRTLARPLGVLTVRGLGVSAIEQAVTAVEVLRHEEDGVSRVVVGLPRRLDGTDNDLTPKVRLFSQALGLRTGLPITLQDERLTSREAESRLAVRERDWRVRKARLDAAAAAIILQDYLDETS